MERGKSMTPRLARMPLATVILLAVGVATPTTGNIIRNLSTSVFSSISDLGQGFRNDLAAVKQPIDETIAYVWSSQCSNVKQILGISYSDDEIAQKPDLNLLTLQYRTETVLYIFNITTVIKKLPQIFNPNDKIVILIHGFTSDPYQDSVTDLSESFVDKGGYNVMALDASPFIKNEYLQATSYVSFIGQKLGEILAAMYEGGLNPDDILIIGHSLGSHIAGFAGKTFSGLTGYKVGRISSLDPAGPCFSHEAIESRLRLKKSDAQHVDVIHTDAGVYGLKDAIGHVDFYVNGGSRQPNCLFQTCSHSRAWLYYTESVTDEHAFPAKKCQDWATFKSNRCGDTEISYMGFASQKGTKGVFYLRTGDESPYGLWSKGLEYTSRGIVHRVVNAGGSVVSGLLNVASQLFG